MTRYLIKNADVMLPTGFRNATSLEISDGRIEAINPPVYDSGCQVLDFNEDLLLPGLFDIQVNGGGGVLFNDAPTVETLKVMSKAHRGLGSSAIMPTIISDNPNVIEAAIEAVDAAILEKVPGIMGIHIEGPCLSDIKAGIHARQYLRPLDLEFVELLSSLKHGKTLVTLAPEQASTDLIKKLTERCVKVSLGHSNADHLIVQNALDAGATGFTHVFNAMSQMTSREPGMVGTALSAGNIWASIIADNIHVAAANLNIAIRTIGHNKLMLITDAMPNAGAGIDHFYLHGKRIEARNGKCVDENGTLAGATLSLPEAIQNMVSLTSLGFEDAVRLASINPARFLGLDDKIGHIETGKPANFLRLSKDFEILDVCANGIWNGASIKTGGEQMAN